MSVAAQVRTTKWTNGPSAWLWRVPEHWTWKRLKYTVNLVNEKIEAIPGLEYLGLEHIESWSGRKIEPDTPVVPDGVAHRFRYGDVLFGKLRPYLAKVLCADSDGMCSTEALVLRPQLVDQRYLFYYLISRDFIHEVDSSTYGSKMPRASWNFIGNMPCLLPPRKEQRAIAVWLDDRTKRIDDLIAAKRRLISLLAEQRTALITKAVSKGLKHDMPLRNACEWLDSFPASWKGIALKRLVCTKITDGPHETPELVDEGVPFVSAEAVQGGRINFAARRGFITEELHRQYSRKCHPRRDDLFLVKSGATTGKVAIVETDEEFSVWSPLAQIRADSRVAYPRFLYHALQADYVQHQIRQLWSLGTQPNIGMGVIETLWIAVPPVSEQRAIVAHLDLECVNFDTLTSATEAAVKQLLEYRQSLISAAVTGQIDMRVAT